MDDTYALKLIEAALDPTRTDPSGVEAVELIHEAAIYPDRLRVLLSDGPRWYEVKLVVIDAKDVTADDEREVVEPATGPEVERG